MAVSYVTPAATHIFGVFYAKGATVDVSTWNDRAIQRALDKGWITPATSGASAPALSVYLDLDKYWPNGKDPTDATKVTAALVAALADTPDQGEIIGGPSTYIYNGADINQNGFRLRGISAGLTKFQLAPGVTREAFAYNRNGTGSPYYKAIEFMDVSILGVTGSGVGVSARWCNGPRFVRANVNNHGSHGVLTFQCTMPDTEGSDFSSNGGHGWAGGQQNDAGDYRSSSFNHNTLFGLVLGYQAAAESAICHSNRTDAGCTFIGNGQGGAWVRYANTVGTRFGGYFEGNALRHVLIGESGGGQVGDVVVDAYLHNGLGVESYDAVSVIVRGAMEGVTTGWLMHNRIKWTWDRVHVISATVCCLQDADGGKLGPVGSLTQMDGRLMQARNVFVTVAATGNTFVAADSAATSITGDIELIWAGTAPWATGTSLSLMSKYNSTGNQKSWDLETTAGTFQLVSSVDGTATRADASAAHGLADGAFVWLKVTRASGTGQVIVSTSPDGTTWTVLSTITGTAGAIFDSTSPIEIGSRNNKASGTFAGSCRYAEVRNGIGGPLVALFDPRKIDRSDARRPDHFADGVGNTWINTGSGWDYAAA